MRLLVRTAWVVKAGNAAEEFEDAFWPDRPFVGNLPGFRCAVADGATETSFSGLWARQLTRAYCRGRLPFKRLDRELLPLQQSWWAEIGTRPLPWYAEEKVRRGAFSSLLGLELGCRDDRMHWRSLAVGDSCLFQIRSNRLVAAFPIERSADFDNRPVLLSSNAADNRAVGAHRVLASGDVLPGDHFWLMTDALACWFLGAVERRQKPWWRLGRAVDLETLVSSLRTEVLLRNDDVTLMHVEIG